MQSSNRRDVRGRRPQIESFEARLLLAAQPLDPISLDPLSSGGAALQPAATTDVNDLTGLNAERRLFGLTGAGQTVAVIDSGIAYDHPALGGGYGPGYRVVGGWDFAENDSNPYDDRPAGSHGTHVAGIVGSADKTSAGVAPSVDLVALRVFDDQGNGDFAWVDEALQWVHSHRNAFTHPITTVNLSLGTEWNSSSVPGWAMLESDFAQLKTDGMFITVAAGNSFAKYNAPGLSYPAASSYVVPVSSIDNDGTLSAFSQRSDRVIAAPGRAIRSTVPDYVGNLNGKTDDFASFSGTSMASPYVAGSAVLLRQAMQLAGVKNVNEDAIYSLMRNTADTISDPITHQMYNRLDVERAMGSILPDDGDSTPAAARNFGVTSQASASGLIARLNDHDYFTFTASQSGLATFTATTSEDLRATWELVGGGGSASTGGSASAGASQFSFNVLAGHSYTVGLSTGQGLGHYSIQARVDPGALDWGLVDFKQQGGVNLGSGEAWFSFTASRTGFLTAEAFFAQAGGNVNLELYDSGHHLLGSSGGANGMDRIDAAVQAGDVLFLHVVGSNSRVDFRLTNLVTQVGRTVNVAGTAGNDVFTFQAGTIERVSINGVSYQFDSQAASTINFDGAAGSDTATLTGSSGNDTAVLRPGHAQLSGDRYTINVTSAETILIAGGGGADKANFYDSPGNDIWTASPHNAAMTGPGFVNAVRDFSRIEARSSRGQDKAYLTGSAGNDILLASPGSTTLYGLGFYNVAAGFRTVEAGAAAGGQDQAYFSDSVGNDTFTAWPTNATMLYGSGASVHALGFGYIKARSSQGGRDVASMFDSAGDDLLSAKADSIVLSGAGFYNLVQGFKQVDAFASAGVDALDRKAVDNVFHWIGNWQARA